MITRKRCRRCCRTRPVAKFWRDRRTHDNLRTICTTCATKARGTRTRRTEIDPAAVDRAVAGDPPATLTAGERRAAVRILTERGLSSPNIAAWLHVAPRTVTRDRALLRLVPPVCTGCVGHSCRWHADRQAAA